MILVSIKHSCHVSIILHLNRSFKKHRHFEDILLHLHRPLSYKALNFAHVWIKKVGQSVSKKKEKKKEERKRCTQGMMLVHHHQLLAWNEVKVGEWPRDAWYQTYPMIPWFQWMILPHLVVHLFTPLPLLPTTFIILVSLGRVDEWGLKESLTMIESNIKIYKN